MRVNFSSEKARRMILNVPRIAAEDPIPIKIRPIMGYTQNSVKMIGNKPMAVIKIQIGMTFFGP